MNKESRLHGNAMCTDCENLIKALNAEILSFNGKIETLKNFTDNDCEGDSAEAMNAKCLELSAVIEKMIEGDKKDIRDLKLLKEKVRDIYIDGEDVLEKMDTAQRGARECYEKAVSLSHAAELAETPWEKDYLNGLASASRSQGESWDRIYDFWKGQAELYDEIDSETSTLFTDGIAYHREASTMMVSFLRCRLMGQSYKSIPTKKLTGVSVETNERIEYAKKYLKEHGLTDEQIDSIDQGELSSLYATLHWSTDDAEIIVKKILKETNSDLYDFLKARYNWDDEKTTDYLYKSFTEKTLDSLKSHYEKAEYSDIDKFIGEKSNEEDDYPIKFNESVVHTREEMYNLSTYDLLARCIYQERHPVEGQEKVAWSIINRFFSGKNFTHGEKVTLRNLLTNGGKGGQYESLDINNKGENNAYNPDFDSDGWRNAKKLAYIIYSVIQEEEACNVEEIVVIDAMSNSENINGKPNINTIGNSDSFYAGDTDNIYYSMGE